MTRIPVAVVGASGYSGNELIRLLLFHEGAELVALTSRQSAGRSLVSEHPRFRGIPQAESLSFVVPEIDSLIATGAKVAFLALPHGVAWQYAEPLLGAGLKVIDLSDDFRVKDPAVYAQFRGIDHPAPHLLPKAVYGLPEIHADAIRSASLIASPGCYPTSVLLPLLPLLSAGCIDPRSIRVASMSGVSGAGRKEAIPLLFCECNESVRAYNAPGHRHLAEIEQELSLAAGEKVIISFTPHLVPVTAGIATTIYADAVIPEQVAEVYEAAYGGAPFVRVLGEGEFPDTKNVTGTNFIDIGWVFDPRTNRLVLFSAEDNLGKGAASQALQSFNLMFDFPEVLGLNRV